MREDRAEAFFEGVRAVLSMVPLVGAMLELTSGYQVQENLDNYWRTLDDDDRQWTEGEEINCRIRLNMKCMVNESFKNCKNNYANFQQGSFHFFFFYSKFCFTLIKISACL